MWLSINAKDTWHTLNHAPGGVAAENLEANCTKTDIRGLQESCAPGTPTCNQNFRQPGLLSKKLVTSPFLFCFSFVLAIMGVLILVIGI